MRTGNQSPNRNPGFPSGRALAEVLTRELGPDHSAQWSLFTNGGCWEYVGWTRGCTRVSSTVKACGPGRTEMGNRVSHTVHGSQGPGRVCDRAPCAGRRDPAVSTHCH